jgi:hypothetical protein
MPKLNDMTAPAKDARSFDEWFYKQPRKQQERMREHGVLPYAEMVPSKHVFDIDPNHHAWAVEDGDAKRTEVETFISRDHVGVMLKAFIDALAVTNSLAFRRHVELIRWALSLPGCLDSRTIGKMHRRTHDWVQYNGRKIRQAVNGDAVGHFPPHVNARRDKHKRARM